MVILDPSGWILTIFPFLAGIAQEICTVNASIAESIMIFFISLYLLTMKPLPDPSVSQRVRPSSLTTKTE